MNIDGDRDSLVTNRSGEWIVIKSKVVLETRSSSGPLHINQSVNHQSICCVLQTNSTYSKTEHIHTTPTKEYTVKLTSYNYDKSTIRIMFESVAK